MSDRDHSKDRKLTLSVHIEGTGDGTVKSKDKSVDCDHDCKESFAVVLVELKATARDGSTFKEWTGPCVVSGSDSSTCTVTMDADKSVTATFTRIPKYDLTVTLSGNGTGMVTSEPHGISCGGTAKHGGDDDKHGNNGRDDEHGNKGKDDEHGGNCHESFLQGNVELTAKPIGGAAFTGWSGACTGTDLTCTVALNADARVTATFGMSVPLTVVRTGTGTGTVTSVAAGIACGATCNAPFTSGSTVVLTAVADAGSIFTGWSSAACPGTGTCSVSMSAAASVTATFQKAYKLTVSVVGANGRVTSPAGIDCPTVGCSQTFEAGKLTVVTLTAATAPNKPRQVITWTSCPSSSGDICTVTMNSDVIVSAAFADLRYQVSVTLGTGGESVVASNGGEPGMGFTCPGVCTQNFLADSLVTLTAEAGPAYDFAAWVGACVVTDTSIPTQCVVTVNGNKTVEATFTLKPVTANNLTVKIIGYGQVDGTGLEGCLNETPSASSTCYYFGLTGDVTLKVTAFGSVFAGWSGGGCSGTDPSCTVTMSKAWTVTATFKKP